MVFRVSIGVDGEVVKGLVANQPFFEKLFLDVVATSKLCRLRMGFP